VSLDRGGRRVAWTYRYRYRIANAARIAGGDYQALAELGDRLIFGRK
jgi:hypothetical protein